MKRYLFTIIVILNSCLFAHDINDIKNSGEYIQGQGKEH